MHSTNEYSNLIRKKRKRKRRRAKPNVKMYLFISHAHPFEKVFGVLGRLKVNEKKEERSTTTTQSL